MRVSVVIPARNEERWLPICLESLADQSVAPNEIIVVDNGSTDDTAGLARSYGCTVISEPTAGVGRARYTGCRAATSEIIATTDADTRVPPDWTARIMQTFAQKRECVGLTGPWHLFDGSPLAQASTMLQAQGLLRAMALLAPATVNMVGCNSAFRAEAYERVGGFRPDMKRGEDLNLSLRLRAVGQVRYVPDLTVHTSARRFQKSFLAGIRQYMPDATRQVVSYLLGRRDLGVSPSIAESLPTEGKSWKQLHGLMEQAIVAALENERQTTSAPALAGYGGFTPAAYELHEEYLRC